LVHNDEPALTEKERLSDHDDAEASIVAWVLGADEHFLKEARGLIPVDPSERDLEAERVAKAYVPNRGLHRSLIANLLIRAADLPGDASPALVQTFLVKDFARAVWVDDALDELDPRRRRERWTTLELGAERLARRGAGKCIQIGCRTTLAKDQFSGRSRPTYCGVHQALKSWERDSHQNEIRQALDAATGQRRRRRARRRAA
jgi:hypothetical protein